MTDEAALRLAEAMERLAAAIEKATGGNGLLPTGLHVHHHGLPQQYQPQPAVPAIAPLPLPRWPSTTIGEWIYQP